MKRLQLFEFEDFGWLPDFLRTGMTNLIVVFHKMMKTPEILANEISVLRDELDFDRIVDLGSGSGGAMPFCLEKINEGNQENPLQLLLSDLHPNKKVVERINNDENHRITYVENSVNATDFKDVPSGLKTMVGSFHHMSPDIARSILISAEENGQPFMVYELAKNTIPTLVWWLFLPLSLLILIIMSLVMTFFVRPLTFSQLFFTFIIPIIPILYAWDGQASLMRTYTFDDVKTLIGNKENVDYEWEVKDAFMAGPFVNFAIKDEVNNRLVVLEGFVFAPSTAKRDYIFELESIIRSVTIK